MTMERTPNANRLHVAIYGVRNSGKSSLINAITGEQTSVVSPLAGTTTDSVARAMELHGIGALLLIDTPGFDDYGEVGEERVKRAHRTIERSDMAMLICQAGDMSQEREWMERLKELSIPVIPIINKIDERSDAQISQMKSQIEELFNQPPLLLSAKRGVDIELIREEILRHINPDMAERSITAGLVEKGDVVMLVMPQDPQAPKGRLILPQVQTLRELLDIDATVISTTSSGLKAALSMLNQPPKLIITDSQAFEYVHSLKPKSSQLTSFSILMAGYKGDIESFVRGARAIDSLTPNSRVLIAEACSHAPMSEDIGRVKIPRMLRTRFGEQLGVDVVAGRNFPEDLTPYSLIIHCGGCMFNRKYMMHRVEMAHKQGVPITNYGVAMAHLTGILPHVTIKSYEL
ncbi:MAG: [FeFe] hydrogenase H-cluster maturation GTPase HydF [Rikenellaceae bacterium]